LLIGAPNLQRALVARFASIGEAAADGVSGAVPAASTGRTLLVERFRQRAAAEAPNELRAHAPALRASLVAALSWLRQREVTDSLVDLLIQVIHKIGVRAEKRVEKELLDDFRRVTGKSTVLFHIAEAAVEQPDGCVRDVVFPAGGGEQKLRNLVREYKSSGPAFRFQVHTYLRASYASHYLRTVPRVLQALEFRSNNATHQPLIEALELLKRYANSNQRLYPANENVPLLGVVPPASEELVAHGDVKGKQRIDRVNYEICVLRELRERLRCKEIWVVGADRYPNPDEDLPRSLTLKQPTQTSWAGSPCEPASLRYFAAGDTNLNTGPNWVGRPSRAERQLPRIACMSISMWLVSQARLRLFRAAHSTSGSTVCGGQRARLRRHDRTSCRYGRRRPRPHER
jgi:hypothetical protein